MAVDQYGYVTMPMIWVSPRLNWGSRLLVVVFGVCLKSCIDSSSGNVKY